MENQGHSYRRISYKTRAIVIGALLTGIEDLRTANWSFDLVPDNGQYVPVFFHRLDAKVLVFKDGSLLSVFFFTASVRYTSCYLLKEPAI